jgi:integrase
MGALNKLNVKAISSAQPGKLWDGGGLFLIKRADGGGQWVLRITILGRRREMGLGAYPAVGLAEARRLAEDARAQARGNVDPIIAREIERQEAVRNLHSLREVAIETFETLRAELKRGGDAGRWYSPLALHVLPKLGDMPITQIKQNHIRDALKPIWQTKADTARKAMNRLRLCFRHAVALGLPVDLMAVENALILLGKQTHKPKHIPALHWQEVPEFYASLDEGSVTHLALRMLILTGVRSGPLRHMHEDQIVGDVWTIPGEAMKGRKGMTPDFRVPLVPEGQDILNQVRRFSRDGFLFPSYRKGVLSDQTMSAVMKRRGMEARPHGFRTSLRVWLAETTDASHEVAEMMLAHQTGGKVVNAYRRTDFLEQRRVLLARWTDHVTGGSGQVIRLRDTA